MTRARRALDEALAPGNRWFVAAVVVGLVLRVAWIVHATSDPSTSTADTAQHLSMADQFSRFESYRLHGNLTSYHAPGYPFVLTPMALLSRTTGWFSLSFGAAVVNVLASTTTIVLGAELARRWLGPATRTPAAWLLALAAGPIYLTSLAFNETVHTTVVLAALLALTVTFDSLATARPRTLVGVGALIGGAILIRSTAVVLVVIAVLVARRAAGSWRGAVRSSVIVVGVSLAVLGPWVLRNGLQVGVWAPSGNGAAYLCLGHRDDADVAEVEISDEEISACFDGTAYGPDPDEARWYRESMREAVAWALQHPVEEARLLLLRLGVLYADDSQALTDAADFGAGTLAGPRTTQVLDDLADGWHRAVLALGLLAFVLVPRARAAWPLWGTVLGLSLASATGAPLDRYHHTTMALLAVFGAGTLVAMGRWASAGVRDIGDRAEAASPDEPPPPDEGLARVAARRGSRWSGWGDHAFEPILLAVATGAWASALVFDAVSMRADAAFVYARGAWLLTGLGLAAGLLVAVVALLDLLEVPRGTVAFRVGIRRLVALDVALVLFSLSFLVRQRSDFLYHDPSPTVAIVLSVFGLVTLAVVHWLGGTLTYGYGLRVALDEDRRKGFEAVED